MLRFLGIRHMAVIDRLDVELSSGLNVLTGETGAGKSIIVEAIGLLLGGRASGDLVRTGEAAATIQAVLELRDGRECLVRREISSQGRSRAFIDDALVTTAALKALGDGLVELHGQHEHQSLLDPASHLGRLDTFIGDPAALQVLADRFARWRTSSQALERSRLDSREKQARVDMISFQLKEIDAVMPREGEFDELRAERTLLANANRLSILSTQAYADLYEGDTAALVQLTNMWKRLSELAALDPDWTPFLEQKTAIKSSLDDLAFKLRDYASRFEASPERLEKVEARLATLERLVRKYGPTLDDVVRRQHAMRDELSALTLTEQRATELEVEERTAAKEYLAAAQARSKTRQEGAPKLARALETSLAEVAMPESRVAFKFYPAAGPDAWTEQGIDNVEVFLSANLGEELRPLARIASGGELSRVMLSLRTLAADEDAGRTLVFDEVDAGIGGAAATAVGRKLHALGCSSQVLCITHLPQIAARANAHFRIEKRVEGGRTSATVTRLDAAGRTKEVARMLAGTTESDHVMASARELIEGMGEGESEITAKGEGRHAKGKRRGA